VVVPGVRLPDEGRVDNERGRIRRSRRLGLSLRHVRHDEREAEGPQAHREVPGGMRRRAFLRALAAIPVVAAFGICEHGKDAGGEPFTLRTPEYDLAPAPTKPRYLRARMTFGEPLYRKQAVATVTGLHDTTFWLPGKGLVSIEGSEDGVNWKPAPNALRYTIEQSS
jgi:hypothetical protein